MDDATAESDPFSAPVEAASQELTPMDDRPAVQGGPRDGRYRRDEGIVTPLFGTPVEEIQELAAETASIEPPPVRERPRLIRAWLAALVFDGERAYEAYRGRTAPIIAALMTAFAVALALLVSTVVPLLSLLGEFAAGDLLRFLGESFVRALLMAAQVVLALFIAAWVASYIGRKRFGSEVGAVELFSLSGLFYAPASLLFVALTLLTTVAANALGAAATTPAAYTLFVFFIYLVGGVVYSNAVIHRVPAWPAAIISTAALLAAGLVLVWLLPLTAPLRAP